MKEPARVQERLRILFVARGLLISIMYDSGESAIARGAERNPLDRVRAVADAVVHFAARQHQLDRATFDAGAERR